MSGPQNESRDWQGVRRLYRHALSGSVRSSLHALADHSAALDRRGVLTAWGLAAEADRTVLRDIRQLPCAAHAPVTDELGAWPDAFEADVARLARTVRAPALALGGGLDAAAVLGAWKASGAALPGVMTLATGLAGYDEVEEAVAIAASVGATCEVVSVSPQELAELLPDGVTAAETPLYNMHPIGRLALARAARKRGYETLVTGDGADAAFAGRPDHDYVPSVAALTQAAGMALASPFLEPRTLAATLAGSVDREKRVLRTYAAASGLPSWLSSRPKRARFMPAINLSKHLDSAHIGLLAHELDMEPRLDQDRERVGWITLGLLVRSLRGSG